MSIIKRRKYLKLISLSFLTTILLPNNLLLAVTKKIINPNLSEEQKKIMFKEGTERPFTSPLNNEKRDGFFIVQIVELNFLRQIVSLTVELDGHPLVSRCQVHLILK